MKVRGVVVAGAAVVLVAFFVGSCGRQSRTSAGSGGSEAATESGQMPEATIKSLLLQYQRLHCSWNSYSYPYSDGERVRQFFSEQVQAGFLTAGETGNGFGSGAQNFTYVDLGNVRQLAQFWWEPPYEIRVKDCMYLPSGIQILDTTYDASRKSARVIFRNSAIERTGFAAVLFKVVAPPAQQETWIGPSVDRSTVETDDVELAAELERLDATGWRVNAILRNR